MDERGKGLEDSSVSELTTRTEVDLGEDLLESTITEARPGAPIASSDGVVPTAQPAPAERDPITEALESAKILEQEGFLDDAKRVLRRVLLKKPGLVSARKRLEAIQDKELKSILDSRESPQVPARWKRGPDVTPEDPESVMRELDRDLELGIFEASGGKGESSPFQDSDARARFDASLKELQRSKKPQSRVDLGVALLEMGLAELSLPLFDSAIEAFEQDASAEAREGEFGARVLACESLVRTGDAFGAVLRLETLIADPSLPRARKVELYYLLARAQERLGRPEETLRSYRAAAAIEPHYRDVDERIRVILERKLRGK